EKDTCVTRIILIDDHNLFRAGIKSLLASQPGLSVVSEASDAVSGLDAVHRYRCDLVVLDYNLPDHDGVWLVEKIRKAFGKLPVLVLSQFLEPTKVRRILQAGAFGYVVKAAEENDLLAAITAVGQGGLYVHHAVAEAALWSQDNEEPLSEREEAIVGLLAEGVSNKEMADRLNVSLGTVKRDLSLLFEKFSVSDRTQLLAEAMRQGLTSPEAQI
ncbi:MAG: response regulator transcription factor, partial [Candidatus Eremiobacteraeota bacterium]|nr:response regulator transcription factor [Candidatus Eremiobacteraeota bacterium]